MTGVVTEIWRAYQKAFMNFLEMLHESVNHSLNFVDHSGSTKHTQYIEGFWSRSEYFLRKRNGISFKNSLST